MSTVPTSPNTLASLNKSYTLVKRMPHFFPTSSRRRHSQTRFFLSGGFQQKTQAILCHIVPCGGIGKGFS